MQLAATGSDTIVHRQPGSPIVTGYLCLPAPKTYLTLGAP
jgi:hypothetical protein